MTTGPNIPQERRLVTAIPGPKSQEIIKRRNEAVSASLGMAIPRDADTASFRRFIIS